jgi:SAM-dependent methyltransferase
MKKNEQIASFDIRNFFKRWPKFYFFVATVFGPLMFCGLSGERFLKKYPTEGKTLNLGSGPRKMSDASVINVDIYPYAGVGIVADALAVPLPEGSVARIISDNVFEHVTNPQAAVSEMKRLLRQGGVAYIATPFLYPFHSSPSDYQRWTKEGLIQLFHEFELAEIGVRAGPFSALTVYLNHLLAMIFSLGSKRLSSLILNLVMFITFPIKLLDVIFNHWPNAEEISASLYCVVRKK